MKNVETVRERERESSNLKNKYAHKINTKGITLIALIVTIIVLLILAGVTIATLTGENGLLDKAKLSREKQQEVQIEEEAILANYEKEIEGAVRDFGTSKELYKLNNPTWEAVPSAQLNDDVTKYKLLRIDFISCWWENTTQPILIENIWLEPSDLNIGISCSLNLANWYIYNTFKFNNNIFTINSSTNLLFSGSSNNNQTANIYRVVGYN